MTATDENQVRHMYKDTDRHFYDGEENDEEERAEAEDEADVDEIIEKLRRNPDLDEHEQRLLGCIVDTGNIS